MSTLLAEQPWMVSIMLAALGIAFLFVWVQTGKKAVAALGLVCFVLIPGAFAIASSWQTEREAITVILHETAAAIEANDHERAVSVIGDEATKRRALAELPNFTFEMAAVNQIREIFVREDTVPVTADVDLSVKVDVSAKRGGMRNVRVLRRLQLEFEKRGETWVVTKYFHSPVIGGPDQYSGQYTPSAR